MGMVALGEASMAQRAQDAKKLAFHPIVDNNRVFATKLIKARLTSQLPNPAVVQMRAGRPLQVDENSGLGVALLAIGSTWPTSAEAFRCARPARAFSHPCHLATFALSE